MADIWVPKHRPGKTRIRHDIVVDRYWRHKKSRTRVTVTKHLLVDGMNERVVFFDPDRGQEFSLSIQEMCEQYEPDGNLGTPVRRPTFHKKYGGKKK